MKKNGKISKIAAECGRVLIGLVFIFSGTVKAIDPMGGAIKIGEYLSSFGLDKFQSFAVMLSFNLSAIEFTLGVCLLLGVYRRYTALLTLLFMAFMTPLTLYLALFNPVSDCGCFGDAVVISNWETFWKNVVLLAAAVVVFVYNQRLTAFYTYKVYWFVALFAYVYCIGFAYHNYNHLPLVDFRPYKVGANIPRLMEIPEGAPEDEYRYAFIYEKDGVQREFSLDDVPAGDSTWTFVESKTELIRQGYVPPVTSFTLYNERDENVADVLLHDTAALLLLVSPKLEDADDARIDEINEIYDYALEHKMNFYCVTGSSREAIDRWIDNTGAEYPFLKADDVLLKTVIRSNPGLVLLKEGTILGKWHYNDLPDEEAMQAVFEARLSGKGIKNKEEGRLLTNLFTFTVPLLLVWVYDYLRNRLPRRRGRKNGFRRPVDKD